MIRLDQAVIVEGKYDKINLENYIDALIIPTNGFSLFKDSEKLALIRKIAEKCGIIIMTDSDNAGNVIRSYLRQCIQHGQIINVYVPQLHGKERRKQRPGAQGILGVEGLSGEIILSALEKSGVTRSQKLESARKITKTDLYLWSLNGRAESAVNRKKFLKFLGLPDNLTANALIDYANRAYDFSEFEVRVKQWKEHKTEA